MNTNNFVGMFVFDVFSVEANGQQAMPAAGTISRLFARRNAAPNANQGVNITVRKNGADTAVKCTISNPADTVVVGDPDATTTPDAANTTTSCQDVAHSVSFVAGDRISVQVTQTPGLGAPGGTPTRWSAQFAPGP